MTFAYPPPPTLKGPKVAKTPFGKSKGRPKAPPVPAKKKT